MLVHHSIYIVLVFSTTCGVEKIQLPFAQLCVSLIYIMKLEFSEL